MTKPILFLDVDGVLNTSKTRAGCDGVRDCVLRRPASTQRFVGVVEVAQVASVFDLIVEVGAQVVVSSSWRVAFSDAAQFATAIGIPPLASGADLFHADWRTMSKISSSRAQEIGSWLGEHRAARRFAVLDDHDLNFHEKRIASRFVQTDSRVGIQDRDLARVRELLTS